MVEATALIQLVWALVVAGGGELHPMDAPIPEQPPVTDHFRAGRQIGTPTTLYVNFDGIELDECNPSDSHANCHWYNNDWEFPPFSGTEQTKIGILQAMRRDAEDYGIRITGERPPDDENYTMVIYGGTEEEYGALGSAPSGDCGDQLPNQIAFAHVDGELNTWVNGGATTALHEAAHSWGLDHVDADNAIMFPAGTNAPAAFSNTCAQIVNTTELEPGEALCPDVQAMFCEDGNHQAAPAVLEYLFGPRYVDATPPSVELVEPENMGYFQAPAEFDVVFEIHDDLHPQAYSMLAWVGDEEPPDHPIVVVEPGFGVNNLPIGDCGEDSCPWDFHVVIADEAGNATKVEFRVIVGADPPPDPEMEEEGCACSTAPRDVFGWYGLLFAVMALRARRRRRG